MVDGLHWAAVHIDSKENLALAQKYGVLEQGIPNVKLINAADAPIDIVKGDIVKADEVSTRACTVPLADASRWTEEWERISSSQIASSLRESLASSGSMKDDSGFFVGHGHAEL